MPASITQEEARNLSNFVILDGSNYLSLSANANLWTHTFEAGNVYATEADAIAARDGWLKVKRQAMERAK
jgi:hypothetical protein